MSFNEIGKTMLGKNRSHLKRSALPETGFDRLEDSHDIKPFAQIRAGLAAGIQTEGEMLEVVLKFSCVVARAAPAVIVSTVIDISLPRWRTPVDGREIIESRAGCRGCATASPQGESSGLC